MYNVLLVCSGGMSTSMLMKKIEAAAEKRGLEVHVWAVGAAEAAENVEKADVLLLGPQVRFLLDEMKGLMGDKPVDAIDMRSYGRMDGEKVLDQVVELLG